MNDEGILKLLNENWPTNPPLKWSRVAADTFKAPEGPNVILYQTKQGLRPTYQGDVWNSQCYASSVNIMISFRDLKQVILATAASWNVLKNHEQS